MWSKVYVVRNEKNQEIGVALMDTQVNIDYQKLSGCLLYLKEEVVILKAKLTPFFCKTFTSKMPSLYVFSGIGLWDNASLGPCDLRTLHP
jgi:hypothetical protein